MLAVKTIRQFVFMLRNTKYALRISYCAFLFLLAGCGSTSAPEIFIAPASPKNTSSPAISVSFATAKPLIITPTALATVEITAEPDIPPTAEASETPVPNAPCNNSLRYIEDINYPDGSPVNPGQNVQKQWRVENNGLCNWDASYRLKLIDGYPALGAAGEQALYPARAGTQAILTINFTVPQDVGTFRTAWQTVDPQGSPFGDTVYMEIIVQP